MIKLITLQYFLVSIYQNITLYYWLNNPVTPVIINNILSSAILL